MSEDPKKTCDRDDVVCQMEVLRHLKGLNEQLGNEAFLEKYPEAVALKEKLSGQVEKQEEAVAKAIDACAEEEPPAAEPEPLKQPELEPAEELAEDAD